ncbi:MAG TPA: hypothetical protein VGL58_10425 [Caulobacteraceae bacterium]|jgi:hypothetical protein
MPISRDEASRALGEIEGAHDRIREITAYGYAAPYFLVWGAVWLIADIGTQLGPLIVREWLWPAASSLGVLVSIALSVTQNRAGRYARPRLGWRVYGVMAAVAAFCVAVIAVFQPMSVKQSHSLFGLVAGFAYLLEGLWLGWRLIALGVALIALTLVGFYTLSLFGGYLVFMGVVGGGALILGGLWLRRI